MGNSVRFACTALAGTNKVGDLKKDANGYFECVVGALNMFNSAGQFYVYEEAKALFEGSSQLQRRVARGALRGEYGHPKMQPGQSNDSFANRVMAIYEDNVCCHHKEITVDFDRVKDSNGRPVIAIISKVLPSGPMGAVLEKSLLNKDENVCFSIRAFTDDYREAGLTKRVLKTVVTFDYVNEPGIAVAEKFKAPALEGLSDIIITRGAMERNLQESSISGIATESMLASSEELFKSMGWSNPVAPNSRPVFLNW
jgi:hypothetical protein